MIAKDDYSTFGSLWSHVILEFYHEAEFLGGGPGGGLCSNFFVLLVRYEIP